MQPTNNGAFLDCQGFREKKEKIEKTYPAHGYNLLIFLRRFCFGKIPGGSAFHYCELVVWS